MIIVFLIVAGLLLALNAFFVLAEFAMVKVRPSRIQELKDGEVRGANTVDEILKHLDEYLSVCQLGITFASIGLGFVAEPAIVRLIEPVLHWIRIFDNHPVGWLTTHGVAFTLSYLLVSFLHILIGELVPKSIAIRVTEQACLWTAKPLRFFHFLFYLPLRILNGSANLLLGLIGFGQVGHGEEHSEDELRILLDQSQAHGLMTFRRLLYLENVFDLAELKVRDAMRPRSQVRCLRADEPWEANLQIARRHRHTRYPLQIDGREEPIGIVHLKDVLLRIEGSPDLRAMVRPILKVAEDSLLESLLAEMQKRRIHTALVVNPQGVWTGFLTLEDIIEEIVGTIRDEFEDEEHISLGEALTKDRIQLGIEAPNTVEAVRKALEKTPASALPVSKDAIVRAVEERERVVETYLGRHLGMPHARLAGLSKPVVLFVRSEQGIAYRGTKEVAYLLVVLLTPAGQPRVHQRLQAVVATLFDESEYIPERLRTAGSAEEVLEILLAGEQATLD